MKTMDPIAIEIGAKIRLAKISDLNIGFDKLDLSFKLIQFK